MIQAICPASCGELLQGWVLGGEKLISYSIDCYSTVTLVEGEATSKDLYPKAYEMIKKVMEYYQVSTKKSSFLNSTFNLTIKSDIPLGKGMASSTADLAATALATATYLGKEITEEEIAQLCVTIEPTDSTVFSKITLFDHLKGSFSRPYGVIPACQVLILEGHERINTMDFRKINRDKMYQQQEKTLKDALAAFELGIETNNLEEIGRAASLSSMANQAILYKEGLKNIIDLAEKNGAVGVNVAHSGTVVGILHQQDSFEEEKFLHEIKKRHYFNNYKAIRKHRIILGGAKIIGK
ncbi:GHMP family kinase ATP-binding protein [Alkaliphilus transvaalensis]|uniref:GHMP family kinase ATP-binding protein n=1 Tax=Alkaliphilus transvaalensis TaxID=114628 RepID=UPI0006842145|nr:hypothetical protein [Alkaliphilus transvaalensis]